MAKRIVKEANAAGPGQTGRGWYAALVFESSYSKPVSAEDLELLERAKARGAASGIPEEKKKALMDYLKLAGNPAGGRFSVLQGEAVANKFIDGVIPDERLAFETKLLEAWCSGGIREFAARERSYLGTLGLPKDERAELEKLLDLALGRSDIILAVTLAAFRVFHPLADEDERRGLVSKAMSLVEGSPERTG